MTAGPAGSRPDGGVQTGRPPRSPLGLPRWVVAVLPLVLLVGVLVVFMFSTPFAGFQTGEPLPDVTVTHSTIPDDATFVLHVTNNGPEAVTVSQVLVDEAYWDFTVIRNGEEIRTLEPRQSARVVIPYHWEPGWDYDIELVLSGGEKIEHEIEAAQRTPGATGDVLWTLTVIGIFVGVIPVALGMMWFPFIRSMSDRWLHAILLFAAGVLAFLAFDAAFEAFELAERVPGVYEGELLIVFSVLGALLVVQAISAWRDGRIGAGDTRAGNGLWLAYLVAIGIGLHNLAEGLAIGSSFALGRVSLGAFLVIGFMLHNVTEGPAVVAPLANEDRPSLWHFAALGAIAGAPVILGGWIGGLTLSPTIGVFFLALGVGAILQVDWEILRMVRAEGRRLGSPINLLAFLVGVGVMYVTDIFVVL